MRKAVERVTTVGGKPRGEHFRALRVDHLAAVAGGVKWKEQKINNERKTGYYIRVRRAVPMGTA